MGNATAAVVAVLLLVSYTGTLHLLLRIQKKKMVNMTKKKHDGIDRLFSYCQVSTGRARARGAEYRVRVCVKITNTHIKPQEE